ncbi:uncharacterized protein CLUP02_08549 [Colletotrichum lupini]|uniref:Uncharacterized protein n=1 Tax=Colletotrichum lupini TaxID=145971 RepID=A0A9Q8STR6_9PEZI|nr:uncharacterized protein CLUP02_08549 [Colletotrichum lupini]UQC83058.1 hypothetical protein CLUP02_08549 [Colletotrichum lupini]
MKDKKGASLWSLYGFQLACQGKDSTVAVTGCGSEARLLSQASTPNIESERTKQAIEAENASPHLLCACVWSAQHLYGILGVISDAPIWTAHWPILLLRLQLLSQARQLKFVPWKKRKRIKLSSSDPSQLGQPPQCPRLDPLCPSALISHLLPVHNCQREHVGKVNPVRVLTLDFLKRWQRSKPTRSLAFLGDSKTTQIIPLALPQLKEIPVTYRDHRDEEDGTQSTIVFQATIMDTDYSAYFSSMIPSESVIVFDRMPMAPVDLACLGCLVKPPSSQPVLTMLGASVAAVLVQTKLHPAAP